MRRVKSHRHQRRTKLRRISLFKRQKLSRGVQSPGSYITGRLRNDFWNRLSRQSEEKFGNFLGLICWSVSIEMLWGYYRKKTGEGTKRGRSIDHERRVVPWIIQATLYRSLIWYLFFGDILRSPQPGERIRGGESARRRAEAWPSSLRWGRKEPRRDANACRSESKLTRRHDCPTWQRVTVQ